MVGLKLLARLLLFVLDDDVVESVLLLELDETPPGEDVFINSSSPFVLLASLQFTVISSVSDLAASLSAAPVVALDDVDDESENVSTSTGT